MFCQIGGRRGAPPVSAQHSRRVRRSPAGRRASRLFLAAAVVATTGAAGAPASHGARFSPGRPLCLFFLLGCEQACSLSSARLGTAATVRALSLVSLGCAASSVRGEPRSDLRRRNASESEAPRCCCSLLIGFTNLTNFSISASIDLENTEREHMGRRTVGLRVIYVRSMM